MSSDRLSSIRGILRRFTAPLLPDDYTEMLNPRWSTREMRGTIEKVERYPDSTIHLVIRPGWGVPVNYRAGQYIGIGVQIDGRYTWRSYSLTDAPDRSRGLFSVTVRAIGNLSNHLLGSARVGMPVRLAAPAGDFHLTEPLPRKLLFVTAGSGVTPVVAMLRSLDPGDADIVVVHSVRTPSDLVFGDDLRRFDAHIQYTSSAGRVNPARLEQLVPDVRERVVYACGPQEMLAELEEWASLSDTEIHVEHFTLDRSSDAQGGEVTFGTRGITRRIDGATTVLEAGEAAGIQMPFGCRMGICQTCVRPLSEGHVRDLRSGETHEPGARIRTCVSVAAGDITIDV